MHRSLAAFLSLAIAATAAAQKLERRDEPKDMATILQTAGKAFEAQRHAAALAALKKAMELARAHGRRAIGDRPSFLSTRRAGLCGLVRIAWR